MFHNCAVGWGEELKRRTALVMAVLLMLMASVANGQTAGSGIANTAHDLRIWTFGSDSQICIMCHAPHNTNTQGPLWNRAVNSTIYTLYASSTMDATTSQPGSVSRLCLSCHDGTVGLLDYGGATGSMSFDVAGYTPANLGTNLSNDHPIGMTYDVALATADSSLADPTTTSVTVGSAPSKTGTIAAVMLASGRVECTSCHDVHNKYTVTYKGLVKMTMTGSALCLKCHAK